MRLLPCLTASSVVAAALAACSSTGGATPAPPPDRPPGGVVPDELKDYVQPGGWIRFFAPPSYDDRRSVCAYVFGSPEEVGRAARLSGPVIVGPDSGPQTFVAGSSAGESVVCRYRDKDDHAAFEIGITNRPEYLNWDTRATAPVQIDLGGRWQGMLRYVPDYTGPTVDAAFGKQWLTEAAKRVIPPS